MDKREMFEVIKKRAKELGYELLSKDYISAKSKLEFVCENGHKKLTTWSNLKRGLKCKKCGLRKFDIDTVKNQLLSKGYELVGKEYKGANKKILMRCKKGHEFLGRLNSIKRGKSCPICSKHLVTYEMLREEVLKRGHNLVNKNYIDCHFKNTIICDKGHEYKASWTSLRLGLKCPVCSKRDIKNTEFFEKKINEDGYSLLDGEYINNRSIFNLSCDKGHEFDTTWARYQKGHRCPVCYGNTRPTIKRVREEFEERGYLLLSTKYKNNSTHLRSICPKGHEYVTTLSNFRIGHNCSKCNPQYSKVEKELLNEIEKFYNKEIIPNDRVQIKPYELDVYIPEHNLAIEFCGLYWHNDDHKPNNYHRNKLDACTEKGIRLLTIFEDEWINQKEIVISKIKQALGITNNKIFARKTEVKEISPKEANKFYEETHLQGKTRGKLHLALLHDGEIVACMTVGSPSRSHTAKNTLEIKRYATKLDTSVVGGFSKLLKRIIKYAKDNSYEKIRSHNDLRYGHYENNVYEKTGFEKVNETKYTPHYTLGQERFRNYNLRKTPEERLTGKTEVQLRKEQGYSRIFDCGHQTYDFPIEL